MALLFFNLDAGWGGGQRHAPAALPPGKTRYRLCGRVGLRAGLDFRLVGWRRRVFEGNLESGGGRGGSKNSDAGGLP